MAGFSCGVCLDAEAPDLSDTDYFVCDSCFEKALNDVLLDLTKDGVVEINGQRLTAAVPTDTLLDAVDGKLRAEFGCAA